MHPRRTSLLLISFFLLVAGGLLGLRWSEALRRRATVDQGPQESRPLRAATASPPPPGTPTRPPTPAGRDTGPESAAARVLLGGLLEDIRKITAETPPQVHYDLFLRLKKMIATGPEGLTALTRDDLLKPPQDLAAQRQKSLIYGALAQSGVPQAWPLIELGLTENTDAFTAFQAVSAAADFAHVPDGAYDLLMSIRTHHHDPEMRSTALLALGSQARRQATFGARLKQDLLKISRESLVTPEDWDLILATVGNHGDPAYWPLIEEGYRHPLALIRGRALFAARALPGPERTNWIVTQGLKDDSAAVQNEALHALVERAGFEAIGDSLQRFAAKSRFPRVQSEALRLLRTLHLKPATIPSKIGIEDKGVMARPIR